MCKDTCAGLSGEQRLVHLEQQKCDMKHIHYFQERDRLYYTVNWATTRFKYRIYPMTSTPLI